MLADAVQSSLHTTPIKTRNAGLHGHRWWLRGRWSFGQETDEEDEEEVEAAEEEDNLVEVNRVNGRTVLVGINSETAGLRHA